MDTLTTFTPADAARVVIEFLAAHPDNRAAMQWHAIMSPALDAGPRGTARAWFTAHDGAPVDTLQVTADNDGIRGVWTPGPRTVDASRAGSVRLNDSSRDYAGMRVIAATPSTLIATAPFGDGTYQVCAYTITPA